MVSVRVRDFEEQKHAVTLKVQNLTAGYKHYSSISLKFLIYCKLIHSANPKSRSVGIIFFAHAVRPYVRTHFSNLEKQNNRI